jgi:hypothetical protein
MLRRLYTWRIGRRLPHQSRADLRRLPRTSGVHRGEFLLARRRAGYEARMLLVRAPARSSSQDVVIRGRRPIPRVVGEPSPLVA